MSSAILSTLHLLALAIGLPGVFMRGRALRAGAVDRVLAADNLWGIAAVLWLVTGLTRAFGSFEKGSGFYLNSGTFLVKMGLFAVVLLLELWPMVTFIKWRICRARGLPIDASRLAALARVNDLELAIVVAMPFVASMMARGIGTITG